MAGSGGLQRGVGGPGESRCTIYRPCSTWAQYVSRSDTDVESGLAVPQCSPRLPSVQCTSRFSAGTPRGAVQMWRRREAGGGGLGTFLKCFILQVRDLSCGQDLFQHGLRPALGGLTAHGVGGGGGRHSGGG